MIADTTFLIAEDEVFMRTVLETILRKEGVRVISCTDGRHALDALHGTIGLDGVILDFLMPRAHGLYVLREIRLGRTGQPRGLPVAILTALSDKATVAQSVALDCDAFLVKPVQRDVLVDRMERLLSRRGRSCRDVGWYERVQVGPPDQLPSDELVLKYGANLPRISDATRRPFPELRAGMKLMEPLCTREGIAVAPQGVLLTEGLLQVLGDLDRITPLRSVAVLDAAD